MIELLQTLTNIPSPTGLTHLKRDWIFNYLVELGYSPRTSNRGGVYVDFGTVNDIESVMCVHFDTLGAIICEVDSDKISLLPIGGLRARTVEGARVHVHVKGREPISGTILPKKTSTHRFGDEVNSQIAEWDNLWLRLNNESSFSDLVSVGDIVSINPELRYENGFIESRFIDNNAPLSTVLYALSVARLSGAHIRNGKRIIFSNFEELGLGSASMMPPSATDFISLDIGIVAKGQNSRLDAINVCAYDSAGPYSDELNSKIFNEMKRIQSNFRVDVFRQYMSDSISVLRAGYDVRTALVCIGCESSHAWERTHDKGIEEMTRFVTHYLLDPHQSFTKNG